MQLIVTLIFLCTCFAGLAQADSVNERNRNKWISIVNEVPDSVKMQRLRMQLDQLLDTTYYVSWISDSDSLKYEEGWYFDNRKVGWWIKYHEDGLTPKLIGEYHNNRPYGRYYKVFANGNLREEGTFHRGKYFGELKRYYESGCLRYHGNYNENGEEVDSVFYYHDCDSLHCCEKGLIEWVYDAHDGKPSGIGVRYYPSGNLMERVTFDANGETRKKEFFEDEPKD